METKVYKIPTPPFKMEKRGRFAALKVFLVFVIVTIWAGLIAYEQLPRILKPEIANKINEIYTNYPYLLKVLYNLRIVLISLIPLTVLFIFIRLFVMVDKGEIGKIDIKKMRSRSKTDIDILYELIKEKKDIKVSTISKIFEIEKELAMDWAKILESSELVTIEYPGFGGPIIKLKIPEEKLELEKELNEKIKVPETEIGPVKEAKTKEISFSEKKESPRKIEINKNEEKNFLEDKKISKKIKKQRKKDEKLYDKAFKKAHKKIKKESKQNKKSKTKKK